MFPLFFVYCHRLRSQDLFHYYSIGLCLSLIEDCFVFHNMKKQIARNEIANN